MPAGAIRGKESEKTWGLAVKAAKEQYPGLKSKDSDRFYAVVMTIYKSMCKNRACSPKRESMSDLLCKLELLEGANGKIARDYRGWVLNEPFDKESKELTKKAVGALNSAMKKAVADIIDGIKGESVFKEKAAGATLGKAWKKHVKPVVDDKRYRQVGLNEPEPRVTAGQILIDVVKKHYGIKFFTRLGDYIF
jgi:hypothetical protein